MRKPASIFTGLFFLSTLTVVAMGCSSGVANDDANDDANLGEQSQALPLGPLPGLPGGPTLPGGPISLSFTRATGTIMCRAREGASTVVRPLGEAVVEIAGRRVTTDATGAFVATGSFSLINNVKMIYEGSITTPAGILTTTTRLQIMNDIKNTRTEERSVSGSAAGGGTIGLGNIEFTSVDCELYRIGTMLLHDYHNVKHASPPAGALRMQRWNEIRVATHTFYDYINISPDWFDGWEGADAWTRENTLFHEFGHSIRHVADGPQDHWNWDNFRWAYARSHSGQEVFNQQYAFNEGWANYWERSRRGLAAYTTPALTPGYRDWNENQIGNTLWTLSRAVGDHIMLAIMIENPGSIHTLYEFEQRFNARVGRLPPAAPAQCPPTFTDDGATCRQGGAVIAKASYGRGVGTVPTQCGSGNELDAGLCYNNCATGYDGVGPVCWQNCPAGYTDDGAFCRRDVQIINSTNHCPWWDACGIATEKGCSTCPAGWQWDGCTCRIDAHIFAKSSYGRGGGWVPTQCGGSQQFDAGLCYNQCATGYNGVGPVCWGSCPTTYPIDDGALCRQPLNILTKY